MLAAVLIGFVLAGCTSVPPTGVDVLMPQSAAGEGQHYWWYCRFKMPWPGDRRPDFSTNLLVAHEVVVPLIERHKDELVLWRFHRRAARDKRGHQFSFIFYASAETAETVYADLSGDERLAQLLDQGVIEGMTLDNPQAPTRPGIAGASDKTWPLDLQRSWPYFIMGVSVTWLDLVERQIDPLALNSKRSLGDRLAYYERVDDTITTLWREQGTHAFFHHISGVFGYEPVQLRF